MAITGIFGADFSSFNQAVETADIKLRAFEDDADKVQRSLTRMTQSLSGTKVIQDAGLMVEAVERIGGASKLTEAELRRVGRTVEEAVEKIKAMGGEVPESMSRLAAETKNVTTATSGWSSALSVTKGVLGAMGIDLAIGALVNFAKGAITSAAALGDLSTATGISTDELQKMAYAGQGFGLSMDTISNAVQKLSADLAAPGPNSAKSAVVALGLSVDQMLAAGPEEAFLQLGEAVGRIEDPMLKSSVAADLFGSKLSKDLNPALGKLRDEMNQVPKDALISKEVIDSANNFEAAVGRGVTRMEAWLLKAGQITVKAAQEVGKALAATGGGPMDQTTFTAYLEQAAKMEAAAKGVTVANQAVATSFQTWDQPQQQVITQATVLEAKLKDLRERALVTLTDAQKTSVNELQNFGLGLQEIASLVPGVTVPALELYVTAQKAAADETKQVGEDNKKIFESVTAFREAADKRQIESMKILQAEELRQAGLRNEQVRAELDARAQLNAAYGLDVTGHQTMGSALDTYTTKLDALHAKKQENIDQYAQEDLLMKEYTDALLEEAKAQDAATTAADKAPAKVREVGNSMQEAAGKTGVFMNQLHMLVDDPKLAAFFGNTAQGSVATTLYGGGATGMTPEMAAAIAAGQFINMAGVGMPRRAGGGGVQRGTTYLVGERGPELFTPGASSGFITPTGGGGSTINISVTQPLGTPDAIARAVSDALAQQARGRGVRA